MAERRNENDAANPALARAFENIRRTPAPAPVAEAPTPDDGSLRCTCEWLDEFGRVEGLWPAVLDPHCRVHASGEGNLHPVRLAEEIAMTKNDERGAGAPESETGARAVTKFGRIFDLLSKRDPTLNATLYEDAEFATLTRDLYAALHDADETLLRLFAAEDRLRYGTPYDPTGVKTGIEIKTLRAERAALHQQVGELGREAESERALYEKARTMALALRSDLTHALRFAKHDTPCARWLNEGPCNCGLAALRSRYGGSGT